MDHIKRLDELAADGFLRKVEDGDLVLYNYTDHCTYEKKWNKYTKNARGTVYDKNTGRVVAKAFPKFFNWEELAASKWRNLIKKDKSQYRVCDKADGSLGIVYYHNDMWRVNTRGSFSSDQALEAHGMLALYNTDKFVKEATYLVEIIYPENRIILDYGTERKLVLLAMYDTSTGIEYAWPQLMLAAELTGLELVKKLDISIEEMIAKQQTMGADEEGFVVLFNNGERVKIKSKAYLRIARILSGASPLALWETMERGKVSQDTLQEIPEEFRKQFDDMAATLESRHIALWCEIDADYRLVLDLEVSEESHIKREIGLGIKNKTLKLKHPAAAFVRLDRNMSQVHEYIKKQIRPTGNILT